MNKASANRQTRSGTHWASMGESTFVAGMQFMAGVHRYLGRVPFLMLLYPVVFYYWLTRGTARRASAQYLQRLQDAHGSLGREPTWRDGVRHFLSFADTILDKMLVFSGRYRFDTVRFVGRPHLQALQASGRGAIFVTAHIGCLEMCQMAARQFGHIRLNVLVHTAHAEKFNRMLRKMDPDLPVELMQVTDITPATAVLLAERVEKGEFVAIAGDRVPVDGGQTAEALFLGHPAVFPVGAYVLASLLRCPLMWMGCIREADRRHTLTIEPLAATVDLPRSQRPARLAHFVDLYVQAMESLVVRAPFEWFNFFPFWDQRDMPGEMLKRKDNRPHEHHHHPS